jgi:simple sugar transport system permease protein
MSDQKTTTAATPAPPTAATPVQSSAFASRLRSIRSWEGIGLFIVFVVLYVALSFLSPQFFTASNQLSILQNASFFGIVAFAMTLVIVAGEIDISVGSMAALSSSLLGVFVIQQGIPMPLAVVLVLGVAAVIGAFAGVMRAYFGIPTFISTLALYLALRGLAQLVTSNFPIPIDAGQFFYWGSGSVFGIPISAIYLVVVFVIILIVAKKTVFGRSVYAVGGNAKAAGLSGIPVKRIKILVMVISAVTAGLTGLLQSALLSSGNSTIAVGLEFQAISATIIGGAALSGGKGSPVGTLIGVLFIAALLNGMVLLNVNPYAQQVVQGVVVLIAVLVNVWRDRKTAVS